MREKRDKGQERESRVNCKRGAREQNVTEASECVCVIKSRLCLLEEGKDESVNKGTRDGGKEEMKRCGMDRLLEGWMDR